MGRSCTTPSGGLRKYSQFLLLSLWLMCLLPIAASAETEADASKLEAILSNRDEKELLDIGRVVVGKRFVVSAEVERSLYYHIELISLGGANWLKLNHSHDSVSLYGIPQLRDVGVSQFQLRITEEVGESFSTFQISVHEEEDSPCGSKEQYVYWIEVLIQRPISTVSADEQMAFIDSLYSLLSSKLDERLELSKTDFRLFPYSYLARYRKLVDTNLRWSIDVISGDHVIVSLNISCGELSEYAIDAISELVAHEKSAESGENRPFQVIQGSWLGTEARPALEQPVETATKESIGRTTRQVLNNRPNAMNSQSTLACTRGLLCRLDVGENAFIDVEDGTTSKLTLSVHTISKNHSNFLVPMSGTSLLEGVPLDVGVYSFRLGARDSGNQSAYIPFQVVVDPSAADFNHQFSFLIEGSVKKFLAHPENLRTFVYQVSDTVNTLNKKSLLNPIDVQVNEVVGHSDDETQTWLRWSNAALPRHLCKERVINQTKATMLSSGKSAKGRERVRFDFQKQMGAQFFVRKVTVELLRTCLQAKLLPSFNVRATTTQRSTDEQDQSAMSQHHSFLLPLILLGAVLLLLAMLIVLCCLHRRSAAFNGAKKKKGKQVDYVSKGNPVVFPEEVPLHEEEDLLAVGGGVTTPMLIAREQPPLDPSKTTLYENPLYRPPPATQATLAAQNQAPNNGGTSTFTFNPPQYASSVSLGTGHKPSAVASAPVGQRPPPTYLAAL